MIVRDFFDNNFPDSSFIYFNEAKEKSLKDDGKSKGCQMPN